MEKLESSKAVPPPVRELQTALDHGDAERIAEAVRLAELNTNSEIVVKLSAATGPDDIRAIAQAEFMRLGVGNLPGGDGIFIYVSLNRRAVEVVVGPQAARLIPQDIWAKCATQIADGFRAQQPADGIIAAVETMSPALAQAFPDTGSSGTELPNVFEGP